MTEKQIQNILFNWRANKHKLVAPNIQLFVGEADLISIDNRDFVYEYEIKVTKSDFKADTKKHLKHHILKSRFKTQCPNYFYYVTPVGLVNKSEVPDYAGLIEIQCESVIDYQKGQKIFAPKYTPKIIKRGIRLHDETLPERKIKQIAISLMWKLFNLRNATSK